MRTPKVIIFSILLIIGTASGGFTQQYDFRSGFIITNANDTIQGWIDYSTPDVNSRKCNFKSSSESDEITNYAPDEIKGFGFEGNKFFVSKQLVIGDIKKRYFLEFLIKGIVNLYFVRINNSDHFFAEKEERLYELTNEEVSVLVDNRRMTRKSKKYVGILQYLMSDAMELSDEINATEFNHNSLVNTAKEYHDMVCDEWGCIIYYRQEEKLNDAKWRFDFGINAGAVFTSMNLTSNVIDGLFGGRNSIGDVYAEYIDVETNASGLSSALNFFPGVYLNLSKNGRLSFQAEANYQSIDFEKITFNRFVFPILASYELIKYKRIVPTITLGTGANYYTRINPKESQYFVEYRRLDIENSTAENIIYLSETSFLNESNSFKRLRPVIFLGASLKFNLKTGNAISLQALQSFSSLVLDRSFGSYPYNGSDINFSDFHLTLSYRFSNTN